MALITSCLYFGKPKPKPINDPSLPAVDPKKPVYQDGVQKRLAETDWSLMHKIALSNKGLGMVEYGAYIFAVGIAVCLAFHNALIDTIGSCIGFFGASMIGIGMGLMWISEIWMWVVYGLSIAAVIGAIVYFRGKGLKLKKEAE